MNLSPLQSSGCVMSRQVYKTPAMAAALHLAIAGGLGLGASPAGGQSASTALPSAATSVWQTSPVLTPAAFGQIRLSALLTDAGETIDQGLIWRVFAERPGEGDDRHKLVETRREASPVLKLQPGTYVAIVTFGRASATRRLVIKAGDMPAEKLVLNAGGLRLVAVVGNGEKPAVNAVLYDVFSDERDQFANRTKIVSGVKPGLILRLNSGIYHLVSTYGDANAVVQLDVTVEPGKLTEATIAHAAGKATFKLVSKAGGDALTDTQWTIATAQGETVKESIGALPTHTLSPGKYTVTAKNGGRSFRRDFIVRHADTVQVEVMRQ
jgi:hypothetical protein